MSNICNEVEFFKSTDDILVVIGNCKKTKIQQNFEPFLFRVATQYPHLNDVYKKRTNSSKDKPGTIKLIGNKEDGKQLICVCFSQYFAGKNNIPSDSRTQRLEWFKKCLTEISTKKQIKTIGFPVDIAQDGGGDWKEYKTAIDDFSQYIKLFSPDTVINIYPEKIDTTPKTEEKKEKTLSKDVVPIVIGLRGVEKKLFRLDQLYILQKDEDVGKPKPKPVQKLDIKLPTPIVPVSSHEYTQAEILQELISSDEEPCDEKCEEPCEELCEEKCEESCEESCEEQFITAGLNIDNPNFSEKYEENPCWVKPLSKQLIHSSWKHIFNDSEIQEQLRKIDEFFYNELDTFGDFSKILPQPQEKIFRAFRNSLQNVKVVILGQDPYHSKEDEAMGFSFSVPKNTKIPPSLKNIYKELKSDMSVDIPEHGDLSEWVNQGVLLLNASLTVRQKKPGCHMSVWEKFTDRIIQLISSDKKHPKVFLLWGNFAQKKSQLIQEHNHIITSVHPSPLSASRGWFGSKPFSQTNEKLSEWKLSEINWSLE